MLLSRPFFPIQTDRLPVGPDEALHTRQDPLHSGHAGDGDDHVGGERNLFADRERAQDDQEVDRRLL